MNKNIRNALRIAKPIGKGKKTFKSGGRTLGNNPIDNALRLALGGRAHFDDGGDVRGGDNPGGLSGDTGAYATSDVGVSQGEVNAATARAQDAQQSLRSGESFDSNAPATPSKSTQVATPFIIGDILGAGIDPADTAMAKQVLSQQKQDAFNAAQSQANAEENKAIAANAAMAQRAGPMTGQPETPTFTGNTNEEQQLKDAEASRQAAINAVMTGANYTAPGTVSAAQVATPVASNIPLESSALYKAATPDPSNTALRAARDAKSQDMGKPDVSTLPAGTPKVAGLGSADLPATKAAPAANTTGTTDQSPRIPVDSLEDPALIAAYNAQYGLSGPKNTLADMALGQRLPNITTNNPLINTVQGANNFLTNLFTPSYNLGSDQYNKISQNPEPEPMATFGGHGGGQQQVENATAPAPVVAAPVSAPVVPGKPVPYTYAKRTPYLDYGAYGSGIGNVAPISYNDPINWALVPGYRAAGGRIGENNALANVLRMIAQNRS